MQKIMQAAKKRKIAYCLTLLIGFFFGTSSQFAWAENRPYQMMVDIYDPPAPFIALDKNYLAYELYVTNLDDSEMSLEAVQVHDKETGMPLIGFDKNAIKTMVHAPFETKVDDSPQNVVISPNSMKFVILTLPFHVQTELPKEIFHRLTFRKIKDNTQQDVETLPLPIEKPLQVMLRPPVRGDYWVAANGLSSQSNNRLLHSIVHGQNYFPARFGIDFQQINLDGKTYQGSEKENINYRTYGKDVYAVARGTVVAVKNDSPEVAPHADQKTNNISQKDNYDLGNYIILEIAKGIYAYYGNLMSGSIKVKVNDKVNEGQELAKIGNNGRSNEPHLHFHVVDRPSSGNGIPYTFTEFWVYPSEVKKTTPSLDITFKEAPEGLRKYSNQLMLENTVVKFHDEVKNNSRIRDNESSEASEFPKEGSARNQSSDSSDQSGDPKVIMRQSAGD